MFYRNERGGLINLDRFDLIIAEVFLDDNKRMLGVLGSRTPHMDKPIKIIWSDFKKVFVEVFPDVDLNKITQEQEMKYAEKIVDRAKDFMFAVVTGKLPDNYFVFRDFVKYLCTAELPIAVVPEDNNITCASCGGKNIVSERGMLICEDCGAIYNE